MRFSAGAVLGWLLLLSLVVDAYGAEPPQLSEADLLHRLERSDPRLEELEARVAAARAEVSAREVLPNPRLSYDREETFASGRSSPENQVRLELELPISGRRGRRIAAAEAAARALEADAMRERATIEIDALELFHHARFARLRVAVLDGRAAALAAVTTQARSRTSAGESSGLDLGRLELERLAFEDQSADAKLELEGLRRALGLLAGEANARYDAADAESTVGTSSRGVDLEALPEVRAARLRIEEAERALEAAGRAWIPSLSLSGGLKTQEDALGYAGGVEIAVPLFDRGEAEREAAIARLRASKAELVRAMRFTESELARAKDALARRTAQLESFERSQLPAAAALVRRAEAAYREGERPVFDLIDAYRTARDVELRHIALREQRKRSELALRRALGRSP